ncbi:MAG: bifunctional glutamate N-acetyltransferase/amino-acid acetyltransferase ArgJ [Chitinispirillales bacterium]|nr:bifunctional glutamate N-acetyltransferase/amino-acid acetyltransferase ArgJ [Chitinispirillales bacterium]
MTKDKITAIPGGVCAAKNFSANGETAGIKNSGNFDLGLVYSDIDCNTAGTFTTNLVKAACVLVNKEILPSKNIRAVICNSGNANACTGNRGIDDAKKIAAFVEKTLNLNEFSVLTASTGVIGKFIPLEKIISTIPSLAKNLSKENENVFATAIMTTDTKQKETAFEVELSNGKFIIGGCCKGAGMIAPNMATMLGFITTDLAIGLDELDKIHKKSVDCTFNNVTVDGDTSTNDMVIVMANGASGVSIKSKDDEKIVEEAFFVVYNELCAKIAEDGEGATKRVEIRVSNGKNIFDCKLAAKSVANSNLTKCAMFGNDPNWGRILCAVGYSGAEFNPENVVVKLCETTVFEKGSPAEFSVKELSGKMNGKFVLVEIDLGFNNGSFAVAHTCDFSYDYVKINAEYHT